MLDPRVGGVVKSARSLLVVASIVVVLLCVKVALNIANKPDDVKLVRDALKEAIAASRDGRPGGVLEVFSDHLKLNGADVSMNTGQVRDFIRRQRPNIVVDNPNPQITGDEARISSPMELDLGLLGKRTVHDVTLIFKKEDSTEYLLIPTRKWKLTDVLVPDTEIQSFVAGESSP